MAKLPWTPWHQVVRIRDDLRSGELSLAAFAADLYDVAMGRARPVYQDPGEFFALTYPTFLAKDVAHRLAGGNEKAVRQLELTYREREEGVQPVLKEDVAEVLRRRFFDPDSIRDREAFRPHVVAALKGIAALDETTRKDGKNAEERYLKSYPFHPDLTEVFYSKWTNLEGFQRTRGILRTFALALRDAETWDDAPLIGVNVFLAEPAVDGISEAPPLPLPPVAEGVVVFEAELPLEKVQDLAERVPDLLKATAGSTTKLHVRYELEDTSSITEKQLERVAHLLEEVIPEFKQR